MDISIIDIVNSTTVDGPGLRTSIYCAGCTHACKGCHNQHSWNINAGERISTDQVVESVLKQRFENVTFSGGDPMFQAEAFADIAQKIKAKSNKNIWCYTGFKFEQLLTNKKAMQLLQHIDTLVDGRFVEEEKDENLLFRGSHNQRIIDVQQSLKSHNVVETTPIIKSPWLD